MGLEREDSVQTEKNQTLLDPKRLKKEKVSVVTYEVHRAVANCR